MEEVNCLVDKIKNIDGKVVKEGKLRTAMRGVPLNQPGTYVESLDGVVREKTAVNEHVNLNGKSSESLQSGPGEGSNTFASLLKNPNVNATTKVVRLQAAKNSETVQGANVVIPMAVVEKMSNRFENTLYGYFIGHRLAFPLVENYVKNAWAKYGLERTMLKKGFFLFQFSSSEGMEKVLENGPWMIRLVPIFLNIWTPNTKLTKDTITAAPIWVKMHNVPIVAYCEEGLSLITSQIGSPIMLDAYTSTVCKKSWGKNDYARALIEVSSNTPMKDNVVVAIPFPNGTGHSLETVDIEYEWVPPRCDVCKVFDHDDVDCPKRVKETVATHEEDDGYTKVTRRNGKKKQNVTKQVAGVKFTKPKPNIVYKVVSKQPNTGEALKSGLEKPPNQNVISKPASNSQPVTNDIASKTNDTSSLLTSNSFESLMNNDKENVFVSSSTIVMDGDDDDEEVENVYNECDSVKGASTPSNVKWKWTSNEMACSKGSRIILGWNPDIVNVVIISFNDQVMHACVMFKAEKKELFCSFIYAHNRYIQRRDLWNNLSIHKRYIRNRPWCVLGDFNVSLSADESSAGSSYINTGMRDFQECVEDMEVADVNSTGLKFTWNQKPKGNDGILKKIDRIMANLEFNSMFMGACAVFQPYRISDHSPAVLRLPMNCE
ncbi:hypothetical protein Tco_1147794, partial [Tanacetum coccineum]